MKLKMMVGTLALFSIDACAARPLETQSTEPMSVLSWNVRVDFDGASWARRKAAVKAVLVGRHYDLVLLQEASEFMVGEYAEILPGHVFVVGERSDGHRGDQGWYEYLPIFHNPLRLERISDGSFWIDEDVENPGGTLENTKAHGRVLSWAIFRERTTGLEFLAANVHIHGLRSALETSIMQRELKSVADGRPVLLAGDFNFTPDSDGFEKLTTDFGYTDAGAATGNEAMTVLNPEQCVLRDPEPCRYGKNPRRIDFIFVSDGLEVERLSLHEGHVSGPAHASDHFALEANIAHRP